MPFFHDGTFHLFYLLDEEHHRARNGFGGHQWAHASSTDLIHWQHHPLALPVGDELDFDYLSICTGSVFFQDGIFYAFYATRRVDPPGARSEHLCLATSRDGVRFTKHPANPIMSPQGRYDSYNFRDPVVFRDEQTARFHMLVTACEVEPELADRAGCLAHLVSSDLQSWELWPPLLAGRPGRPGYYLAPECADYFRWHDWYYLVFSDPPHATTYLLSRDPFGPWLAPVNNTFDTPMLRVFKTTAFADDRRLAVAFLTSLAADQDDGAWLYAGNAVFRELIQHPDGTLGTTWPAEMVPPGESALAMPPEQRGPFQLGGPAETALTPAGLPADVRLSLTVMPGLGSSSFGLRFGTVAQGYGYELGFVPRAQSVRVFSLTKPRTLLNRMLTNVSGLDAPFTVEIVLSGDIIDICIDHRRCLCTRLPERAGASLALFNDTGTVTFDNLRICPLL